MATERQKKAFKKTLENGGIVSRAMEAANYSPAMAKNPQKLTRTKGWQELMDQYLPDSLLAKVHKEGLKAVRKENKIVDRDEGGKVVYEWVNIEDYQTRHKYLDTAYKLKGSYSDEKQTVTVKHNYDELTDEELEATYKARKDRVSTAG